MHDFVNKKLNDFTYTPKKAGEEYTFYFRLSSSLSQDLPSNVVEAKLKVCGLEIIKETDAGLKESSHLEVQ